MDVSKAMLCWNQNGQARVLEWPVSCELDRVFDFTAGACDAPFQAMSTDEQVRQMLVKALCAVTVDAVDPWSMCRALERVDQLQGRFAGEIGFSA